MQTLFLPRSMSLKSIITNYIYSKPRLARITAKVREIKLPGFDGVPLYVVLKFFLDEIKRDVISVRARAISFTFFMALFPALIFVFSLIPYIPVENLQINLVNFIRELLPEDTFHLIENTVIGVVNQQHGELLSISLFFSLFLSTNGVMAMMESFDKSYAVFSKRSAWRKRWVALKLTLVLIFLLVMSMLTIIGGNKVLKLLIVNFSTLSPFNIILFSTLKWIIIILLFFNAISFIYYYGPAVKKKFKFISAGSTLATIFVILISIGFSYFVNNFGQYNRIYGSIGAIAG